MVRQRSAGVEQGFDLAARPAGGPVGRLTLALAVSGNVRGVLAHGAVIFTRRGVSLAYRGLVVSDARGRLLPARIEVRPGGLLLRIDDRRAGYPLRVDPFIQQAKLTASDGAPLGFSVAVSGDTVVAGGLRSTGVAFFQGAVYVFVRPRRGWASETEAAKLTASDGAAFDMLGYSVAVSGDTVVAGAPDATVNGHKYQGAAYVFVKPHGGWKSETEQAKLTTSDTTGECGPDCGTHLGDSVGVSGDTVVAKGNTVLAPNPIDGNYVQGAAYVFVKPEGSWASETEEARLTASDGAPGIASVGVSGDTVVAGAYGATVNGQAAQGAVYVFVKPAGGWTSETEQAKLTASDGAAGDRLGYSVGVSGDTVAAGAPEATVNGQALQGAAYVFVKPHGGWKNETEQAKLTVSDGAADQLGFSVGVSGDTVVADAFGGAAAYVFGRH